MSALVNSMEAMFLVVSCLDFGFRDVDVIEHRTTLERPGIYQMVFRMMLCGTYIPKATEKHNIELLRNDGADYDRNDVMLVLLAGK